MNLFAIISYIRDFITKVRGILSYSPILSYSTLLSLSPPSTVNLQCSIPPLTLTHAILIIAFLVHDLKALPLQVLVHSWSIRNCFAMSSKKKKKTTQRVHAYLGSRRRAHQRERGIGYECYGGTSLCMAFKKKISSGC